MEIKLPIHNAPHGGRDAERRRHGRLLMPDDTIHFQFPGVPVRRILAKGVTLELEGDANDYVGRDSRADG
jgi:glutamate synthase domain-containing protein 3